MQANQIIVPGANLHRKYLQVNQKANTDLRTEPAIQIGLPGVWLGCYGQKGLREPTTQKNVSTQLAVRAYDTHVLDTYAAPPAIP